MSCIKGLDCTLGLDLILHSPGGDVAATESLIDYLRRKFDNNIETFIPQLSMSGGTMLALTGNKIYMGKQSNLGPIDPQLGTLSALNLTSEFERARKEITADPRNIHVWGPILSNYRPGLLEACERSMSWSKDIGTRNLKQGMFVTELSSPDPAVVAAAENKVAEIIDLLTTHNDNFAHEKHIHLDTLIETGLKIEMLEDDPELQDDVLSIHHAYMHSIINKRFPKIIENHLGVQYAIQRQ